MTTLIGTRWKRSNALSRGVLIPRQNSRKELWESRTLSSLIVLLFVCNGVEGSVLVLYRWGHTRSHSEHGS